MNAFSWVWLKRPIFYLLRTIVIYGCSRYGCDTHPILSPNNTHLHTALDIDISRYEYVYWSAHVHVWICICIPWRGQTLHITAYDTMSRSDSNSAVRTRLITKYVFSHASVHITKRALTINVVHRLILYGNIIKRSFNPLLTYDWIWIRIRLQHAEATAAVEDRSHEFLIKVCEAKKS